MYTKGEWKFNMLNDIGVELTVEKPYRQKVCHIFSDNPEAEANAHLIAAAPDMYEALKRVPQLYAEYCALRPDMSAPEREFVQSIIRQVDKALAKAK